MSHNTNKRIAQNTLFLYFRTLVILLVSLYTSRVVLNVLGIDDYWKYNLLELLTKTNPRHGRLKGLE